jgi:hypothetical protein
MRLHLVATALLLAFQFPFCAHTPKDAPASDGPEPLETFVEVNGEELVRTFDLNRDGKADDWKHYKLLPDLAENGKPRELLLRREMDTNFDGKVDLISWFNDDGSRAKESFDLDFDGRPDVIVYYEKGVVIRKETFHGSASDKPDTIAYYEGGKKVRIEREVRTKGKVDTWEYFENGRLTRVGEDLDGDGLVDRWAKAKEPDEEEAAAAAKKAPAKK